MNSHHQPLRNDSTTQTLLQAGHATYATLRDNLATGDIVLFEGRGLISRAIQWLTGSRYSHVGMVVHVPEYDFVCLWESTTLSNVANLVTGQKTRGVQLAPLSQRIANYQGNIAVRLLQTYQPVNPHHLMALRHSLRGREYERKPLQLLRSVWRRNRKADLSSVFCSELVAAAYQHLYLLRNEHNGGLASNQYTPADFAGNRINQQLHPNARLTGLIHLQRSNP